jgi:hypothetical protein
MSRRIAATVTGMLLLAGLPGCAVATETPPVATAEPSDAAAAAGAAADPARRVTIKIPEARSAAPALNTTGTAWSTILASLAGYGQWLLANPDPTKIGNVATPGCATANHLSRQVNGLLRSSAYLEPVPPVFEAVTGLVPADGATDDVPGDKVTINVIASRPSQPVISLTGQQVTTFAPLPQTRLQITLDRGDDNKWRFCTITAPQAPDTSLPVPLL